MSLRHCLLTLACCALAPWAVSADEKYTLKISKEEKAGDKSRHTARDAENTNVLVKDKAGAVLEEKKEAKDTTAIYVDTVLAKPDSKRATKLIRAFEQVKLKKDGKDVDVALDGKSVVCERKDKQYEFKFENGDKVDGEALTWLKEEFKDKNEDDEMEKLMMPKHPVAAGESWKCDVKEIAKSFAKGTGSLAIHEDKAVATGKLLKVYQKNGHNYGVMELTFELPLKAIGPAGMEVKMAAGSIMKMTANLDVCIDGTMTDGTMKATMEMKGTGKISSPDGQEFTMDLAMKATMNQTKKPVD